MDVSIHTKISIDVINYRNDLFEANIGRVPRGGLTKNFFNLPLQEGDEILEFPSPEFSVIKINMNEVFPDGVLGKLVD
jgi:hypothetical protein